MGYRIELRKSTGELVDILENAYKISTNYKINAPEEVVFYIPATDSKMSSITLANEIWVVDSDSLDVVTKTILQSKRDIRNSTLESQIVSMGFLSLLNDDLVRDYDTGETGETIETILNELLAFQLTTNPISVGFLDASISTAVRAFANDGETILRSIFRLHDTIGGFIEIDQNKELNWYENIGDDIGQQIRYEKNLEGIERFIDYTTLKNRWYVYGNGEGDERLKLSDFSGHTEDYLEDVTSQVLWGGIYTSSYVNRSITHPSTLMNYAERLLEQTKNPKITYQISTIDYSYVSGIEFEKLKLGSLIQIIDEDLEIDLKLRVVQINYPDLTHSPETIEIQLDTTTRDITDSLNEVYDIQQLDQHIATKIGAGQVIVRGGVAVLDWASDGMTTINGGKITANTIDVSSLNFTPVGSGNIVASINASTEPDGSGSLQITGSKISISGSTTFSSGYNPASKVESLGGNYDSAASGARVRIFPDANTGILVTDGTNDVFKCLVGGTDVGDVLIGNYAGGNGCKWDKSAGNFLIAGSLGTSSIVSGGVLTVAGSINAGGGSVILDNSGMTVTGGVVSIKTQWDGTVYNIGTLGGVRFGSINLIQIRAYETGARIGIEADGNIILLSYNGRTEIGNDLYIEGSITQASAFGGIATLGSTKPYEHNALNLGNNGDRWLNTYSTNVYLATLTSWNADIVVAKNISMGSYNITCNNLTANGEVSGNSVKSRGKNFYFGTTNNYFITEYEGNLWYYKAGTWYQLTP